MKMFRFIFVLLGIFTAIFEVCHGVEIIDFNVPSVYILDQKDPAKLVLDCNYILSPSETGFVLKWLINNVNVYQFIPSKGATALGYMKGRIDTNYTVSDELNYKHRALYITRPLPTMSGQFTCSVQTFQSTDSKSAELIVIVPESSFELKQSFDGNILTVQCDANDIYPKPNIAISLGDNLLLNSIDQSNTGKDKLIDASVIVKLNTDGIEIDTPISCVLSIPGTTYTKKKETVYVGITTTTSTTTTTTTPSTEPDTTVTELFPVTAEENTSEPSSLKVGSIGGGGGTGGNSSTMLGTTKTTIILSTIFCILLTWLKDLV